jgi:myo-inositol catabolism protein IolC
MMTIGFNKPLYLLPFDHRGWFQTHLFGWKGQLAPEQMNQIASTKHVIYDGFKAAIEAGVPREKAGILVDEMFGAALLRDAATQGYLAACPVEKIGQEEFDFEYGKDFDKHIEVFRPTFCKALVRYNPEGDRASNLRQSDRLRRLSNYAHGNSRSLCMLELLVPPMKAQLDRLKRDERAYDLELRPRLMVQAIEELQSAQVEPDVWTIEGLNRREDCEKIIAAARRGGRKRVSCIIRARGEDDFKVRSLLTTASAVPGFVGFAVSRACFGEPLINWRRCKITRKEAVAIIAGRYLQAVRVFEKRVRVAA